MINLITSLGSKGLAWAGGNKIKIGIAAVAVAATVTVVTLAKNHYTNLLDTIDVLQENNIKLELAVETQNATINTFKDGQENFIAAQKLLQNQLADLDRRSLQYRTDYVTLQRQLAALDLDAAAKEDPRLVEDSLNRSTASALLLLECATGSRDTDCDSGSEATSNNNSSRPGPGSNPIP